MDIGHITQLAAEQLGPSKVRYHLDLTRPRGAVNLQVDDLGAGNFVFVDSGVAGSNPTHALTPRGLTLSIERPAGISGSSGHWAAARTQAVNLPNPFLMVATFERPARVSLNGVAATGVFAPSMLMNIGNGMLMGVTCQFRPEGLRMNLPGTGLMPNRPPISPALAERILDPDHPSTFALALSVHRSGAANTGTARLFVKNDQADTLSFNFTTLPPILDIRAGIGTANGVEYRASVVLLDFQVWGPK